MPMIWNEAAGARLFAAVFKVSNIKLSATDMQTVAKIMGPECTTKAITHRLAKIREKGGKLDADGGGDDETPKSVKKTRAPAKSTKRKAATEVDDEDTPVRKEEEEEEVEGIATPPDSGSGKRKKKRVTKQQLGDGIEVGEDIGEGLRAESTESGSFL